MYATSWDDVRGRTQHCSYVSQYSLVLSLIVGGVIIIGDWRLQF